jgi:tetratricopeptide (TPR) repeat protein
MAAKRQNRKRRTPVTGTGPAAAAPAPVEPPFGRGGTMAAAVLIVAAALAAFSNSFQGVLLFDDVPSITDNPTIRTLWPIWIPLSPPARGDAVQNRPLVNLTLAINYAIHGEDVWGYHAFNLGVHVLAALTLFGIVRRTLLTRRLRERFARSSSPLALAVALIWAVHPLQTEAVTYVIQRTESMMGLLYLLTLYCVLRGASSRRGGLWFTAAVAACFSGMATKEAMVTAPVVVLAYDRIFLCRSFREVFRRRWALYAPLASSWAVLAAILTLSGGARAAAAGFGRGITARDYAITQLEVIVHYLRLCFWPHPLILDYGTYLATGAARAVPAATLLAALLAATFVALRYRPPVAFLGIWFFVILAPTSSVVPLVGQVAAEKRMYLPIAAVIVLVVGGANRLGATFLAKRLGRNLSRACACVLLVGVVAALAFITRQRNRDYHSKMRMWSDVVAKYPQNPRGHYNLAVVYQSLGEHARAIELCTKAIQIKDDYPEAYANRAYSRVALGHYELAIGDYTEAIKRKRDFAKAYNNRGVAYERLGRYELAVVDYSKAIQLKPDYANAYHNRAVSHYYIKDYDKAWADVRKCVELGGKANPNLVRLLREATGRSL